MTIDRKLLQSDASTLVQYYSLDTLFTRRQALLADTLAARGKVVHVQLMAGADGATISDIMALRWIYPGGLMPMVCAPKTQADLAHAIDCAAGLGVAVFLLFEDVNLFEKLAGESRPMVLTVPRNAREKQPGITPRPPVANEPAGLDHWMREQAEGLARYDLDEGPEPKADWLVVSYGLASIAAAAGVAEARKQGLTVTHMTLKTLFPLPERKIAALAMGKRYVVVPERNLGQLHSEIQRVVPSLPVVPVAAAGPELNGQDVLATLMKFPRCC